MPDVIITIPAPILVSGEKFKTRYRELPSGNYTANLDRDNTPFTLAGLSAGQYVMEIIYVRANGEECPAKYYYFEAVAEYECPDFTSNIVQSGNTYYLNITYSTPVNPPCGWKVIYTINNVTNTVLYNPLPSQNYINIPLPSNNTVTLIIRADLCDNKYKDCHTATIAPIAGSCIPAVITKAELLYNPPSSFPLPDTYFIRLTIKNSTPTTQTYNVNFSETSQTGGNPPDIGSYTYNGAQLASGFAFLYSFQVHPNSQFKNNVNGGEVFYHGTLVDGCGVSHPFSVQLP